MIPEPCRSLTFLCFCLVLRLLAGRYFSIAAPSLPLHSPAHKMIGLYLSVAAPSLPLRSAERRMILVRFRSFWCLSNDWMPPLSNDWMSLLSPSRASRTILEPWRSFLTWCFRLSFQQPAGLYLSVAALSLPSCSTVCKMIFHVCRAIGCQKNV